MQTQGHTANADRQTLGTHALSEYGDARAPESPSNTPCNNFKGLAKLSGAIVIKPQKTIIACKKDAHGFFSDIGRAWNTPDAGWSDIANAVRINSPDVLLNHGTQVLFGLQVAANLLGIYGVNKFYTYVPELAYKKAAMNASAWSSLVTNGIGVVFEEKPLTVEDRTRYDNMSWLEYIPRRTLQALMPWDHVGATVSMGMMYGGVTGMIGAPSAAMGIKNGLTTLGGAMLCYDPDRERAWQNSSGVFFLQKLFSVNNAYQSYTTGWPDKGIAAGNWTDAAKLSLNQLSNVVGVLYGGVHVDKHGNIYKETNTQDAKNPDIDDVVLESRTNAPIDFKRPFVFNADQEGAAVPTSQIQTQALQHHGTQPNMMSAQRT